MISLVLKCAAGDERRYRSMETTVLMGQQYIGLSHRRPGVVDYLPQLPPRRWGLIRYLRRCRILDHGIRNESVLR